MKKKKCRVIYFINICLEYLSETDFDLRKGLTETMETIFRAAI